MEISTFEMRILRPSVSENWLTNGETYSQEVYLAVGASEDDWREITNEEYEVYLENNSDESL